MRHLLLLGSFAIVMSLFFIRHSMAQGHQPPIIFGQVSMENMRMSVYEKDTSASAIILCDYGAYDNATYEFTRIIRKKILKKEGYEHAGFSFIGNKNTKIKAFSYNLENGEIIKNKVDHESIIKDRLLEDVYEIKLVIPNVKVGTIVDITLVQQKIPWVWNFQHTIPTVWSEFKFEVPVHYDLKTHYFGTDSLYIVEKNRWVAKDIPAFKEEPFIATEKNHIIRLEILLNNYRFLEYYGADGESSWYDVGQVLQLHPFFGEGLKDTLKTPYPLKELMETGKSGVELLQLAYAKVVNELNWNGKQNLYFYKKKINDVWDDKNGDSAEINFYLIYLLKKLGFTVAPVALSTRSNGSLHPEIITKRKLDYVVACVFLDGKSILLDATLKKQPMGMLPAECINGNGLIISKDSIQWISLAPSEKIKSATYYHLELDDKLLFNGFVQNNFSGYAALKFREEYGNFKSEKEYLEEYTKDKKGMQVSKLELSNLEDYRKSVNAVYHVELSGLVEEIGDELIFYPLFFDRQKENPLKAEERKFAIDFGYLYDETFVVRIKLPEGYEVVDFPKNLSMKIPDQTASVKYQVIISDGVLQLTYKLEMDNYVYAVEKYGELKEFYNQIVKKHSEPVILRKKG